MNTDIKPHLASLQGWLALLPDSAKQQALVDLSVVEQALGRKDALLRQALEVLQALTMPHHAVRVAIEKELQ